MGTPKAVATSVAQISALPLTGERREVLGGVDTTGDGAMRLRPPAGLVAITPHGRVEIGEVARILGEVSIAGRALPATWFEDLDLSIAPPIVRRLGERGLWFEQEPTMLDP